MKKNEWALTVLQIAAPVFAFAVGLPTQGWFLVGWCCAFGITEVVLKATTGKTLSGWVWTKPRWVRHTIGALMTAGMLALWFHFAFGGGK